MWSDAENRVESGQERAESATLRLTSYCTCIRVAYLLFTRAALRKLLTFSLYVALNDLGTVSTVATAQPERSIAPI